MPDPRLREGNGVPSSVLSMAARILEAERKFVSKRREARMELENVSEKDLLTVYQNIARYGGDVTFTPKGSAVVLITILSPGLP